MHLFGIALAQALLLIPHAATAPPPSPQVHLELYPLPLCISYVQVGSLKVDTGRGAVDLLNNKCVKTPTNKYSYASFQAFINLGVVPTGSPCSTTVFSDDACASEVAGAFATASPNNAPRCVEALGGIKSAKTVCGV